MALDIQDEQSQRSTGSRRSARFRYGKNELSKAKRRLKRQKTGASINEATHFRTFFPHRDHHHHMPFCDNSISSTQYTFLTFLPKNLYYQFHRIANIYFLILIVLNYIPQLSTFGSGLAAFPLIFVLTVTALKDAREDLQRWRSDREVNARPAQVWNGTDWHVVEWRQVQVGDIVKLEDGEIIPADILMLHSEVENGLAFLETANIDGETNLKQRRALPVLQNEIETEGPDKVVDSLVVNCEPPNVRIYEFSGFVEWQEEVYSIDSGNLLLRGCVLRNCPQAYGVVLYTGHDTKVVLNTSPPKPKRSKLEKMMNSHVLFQLFLLSIMCAISAIGHKIFLSRRDLSDLPYFAFEDGIDNEDLSAFVSFFQFIILYNVMVPISLYITMELIKLGQLFFIRFDRSMYDDESGKHCQPRAFNLNEDLGQIEFVFSDKTGTLTENEMIWRQFSVRSSKFHLDASQKERLGWPLFNKSVVELDAEIDRNDPDCMMHHFILGLVLNSTVLPSRNPATPYNYEGESPDEVALVERCNDFGYVLQARDSDSVTIFINGEARTYSVEDTIAFNSDRKRSSAIIRTPEGKIRIYSKGADSVMLELVDKTEENIKEQTQNYLDDYAREGLRTLGVAGNDLDEEWFEKWSEDYLQANIEGDKSLKEHLLQTQTEMIEKNFVLFGSTAVEDRLQDGVPETIFKLQQAGMRVWMLTGDKLETAVNIGVSCKLLLPNTQRIVLQANSADAARDIIRGHVRKYASIQDEEERDKQVMLETEADLALIIEGSTLAHCLHNTCEKDFLHLISMIKVCICCRVTPLQKAAVVKLVKSRFGRMTLAIGDGANDVSMIMGAHIGIGVSGKEGMQAVMASDFAIAKFRHLQGLLLVNGAWAYARLARMLSFFFYKNVVLVFVLFYYQFFNGFSGQYNVDQLWILIYNSVLTALPPLFMGIFEQHVQRETLIAYPELYRGGQVDAFYNNRIFLLSLVDGIYQGAVIYFITFGAFYESDIGVASIGFVYGAITTTVVNLQNASMIYTWNWITSLGIFLSVIAIYVFAPVYSALPSLAPEAAGVFAETASLASFWFSLFCCIVICILPNFTIRYLRIRIKPLPTEYAREQWLVSMFPDRADEEDEYGTSISKPGEAIVTNPPTFSNGKHNSCVKGSVEADDIYGPAGISMA